MEPSLRFTVRLLVKHPKMDPALVSERLGMKPRMVQHAGTARKTPKGDLLSGTYEESKWGWSKQVNGQRNFFDEVAELLDRLEPHQAFISDIVDSGGAIEIIFHLPGDVNIGWGLKWPELERLAKLRINLGVEVFPEFS